MQQTYPARRSLDRLRNHPMIKRENETSGNDHVFGACNLCVDKDGKHMQQTNPRCHRGTVPRVVYCWILCIERINILHAKYKG